MSFTDHFKALTGSKFCKVDPRLNNSLDAEEQDTTVVELGILGDPLSVDSLVGLLGNQDANVRDAAALALGRIRDPRAVEGDEETRGTLDGFIQQVTTASRLREKEQEVLRASLITPEDPSFLQQQLLKSLMVQKDNGMVSSG